MIDQKYKEIKDLSSGSYGKVWKWAIVDITKPLPNDLSTLPKAAVKVYIK